MAIIRRSPRLRDQVYDALRSMLHEGTFPLERIAEEELAEQLDVSRTSIREALFQLCREGVLEDTGRGYKMPDLRADDVRELMEFRLLVEPRLGRFVVERATLKQARALQKDVSAESAAARSGNSSSFIAANSLYVGEVAHKGSTYLGQHEAIIDRQTWNAVQDQLKANAAADRSTKNAKAASLLTGLIYDETGD
jgi:DNA-binding GntR family transcriptional regulator